MGIETGKLLIGLLNNNHDEIRRVAYRAIQLPDRITSEYMSLKSAITKLAIVVGIAVSGYSPRSSGCMLTHPFLLQVFGVEADAKKLVAKPQYLTGWGGNRAGDHEPFTALKATLQSFTFPMVAGIFH